MLFRADMLQKIVRREVTVAFRRWKRPTVKAGGQLRTPIGLLDIVTVDRVSTQAIDEGEAKLAGFNDVESLMRSLGPRHGSLYRIRFRWKERDPHIELRDQVATGDDEKELRASLTRLDRVSRSGPWTLSMLKLIQSNPGVRAAELARLCNRDKESFKRDVRKLKYAGLTVSLEVGYELSRRGEAWLRNGMED